MEHNSQHKQPLYKVRVGISNMWTNILKPNTQIYTNLNAVGKEQYDQTDITYDSTTTYYDGVNPNQYTMVAKPTTPTWTNIAKPI